MTIAELAEKSAHITHTYQVTPEVYNYFQLCSKDYNPLHTDEEYAKSKGYKTVVMYGNILNAFVSHFVGMLLPTNEVMIQLQDINYRKPVFLNDEIVLDARISLAYFSSSPFCTISLTSFKNSSATSRSPSIVGVS